MIADGAVLLDKTRDAFKRYVVFPDDYAAVGVVLWTVATHAVTAFQHAPRLVINSPEKRCGKSRLLDIIAGTCHSPLISVNATVAAIYRSIGNQHPPTLLVDEADTLFGSKRAAEQNEDLRALLNAGHQRGRPALRCVGPNQIPTEFPTFAMAALAGIGTMPDTITDRAVNVTLRRRMRGERVSQFRGRRDGPILEGLRDQLAAWCAAQIDALADAEPDMPVEDRAADTWEPLIAVADAAGGRWPTLARSACAVLVARAEGDDEDRSLGARLLSDIQHVFSDRGASFLPSGDLVNELAKIDESPWKDFEFSTRKLAYRLKDFGIKSVRDPSGNVRGYRLEDLIDVFSRYTRQEPSEPSETTADQENLSDTSIPSDATIRQTESIRQNESAGQTPLLTVLTHSDEPSKEPRNRRRTRGKFRPPAGGSRCESCGWNIESMGHSDDCQQTTNGVAR